MELLAHNSISWIMAVIWEPDMNPDLSRLTISTSSAVVIPIRNPKMSRKTMSKEKKDEIRLLRVSRKKRE